MLRHEGAAQPPNATADAPDTWSRAGVVAVLTSEHESQPRGHDLAGYRAVEEHRPRRGVHVTDPDGAITQAWNRDPVPALGRMFLIRPDAYIAAIVDPSDLTPESDLGAQVRAAFRLPPPD